MDLKNLKTSHPAKFYLTAKIPIFRDLEEEELMFICERLSLVEYGFGENVYKSGQKEEYFYFLISGEVGVFKNKNEDPVEVYRRGDFIGLVSFLTGEVHNFTAKAITDIRVFRVTRKIFEEITEHIPSLSLKFSKILSNRIRNIKSKKKLKSNLRTIGIISELTEVKTEEYIKKLLENIKTESGQSTVCLNVFFPPEKKIDEGYTEEMDMPFSSYLEKYLETYDIIFLRINKSQFSKIKKIENEFDKIYIINSKEVFSPEIEKIVSESSFKSNYKPVMLNPEWKMEILEKRINIFAREILEKRLGIAFGGGAALGLAQIGILRVLEKNNIKVDMISGTSIGSLVGGLWCSGIDSYGIEKMSAEFDSIFKMLKIFDITLPTKGLVSGKRLLEFLNNFLGDAKFENIPVPFRAVACDITTRDEKILKSGSVAMAIRKSTAIPGVFAPVEEDGKQIVDGGIINPLPVSVLEGEGIKRIIAVNSMPSSEVMMKSNKVSQGVLDIMVNSLYSLQYRIGKYAANQVDVYMNPILENSSWYEFYRAKDFIEHGEKETEKILDDIKKLCGE